MTKSVAFILFAIIVVFAKRLLKFDNVFIILAFVFSMFSAGSEFLIPKMADTYFKDVHAFLELTIVMTIMLKCK